MRLARDLADRMRMFSVTNAYASFETDEAARALIGEAYEHLSDETDTVRAAAAGEWIDTHRPDAPAAEAAAKRCAAAGKEPLRPRVRVLNRNATPDAFEAMIERVTGEKRVYDAHIDVFDQSFEAVTSLSRAVEIDVGGYGFYPPSSIYHRFMSGLTGGKMSSSVPASHISLLDAPEDGYNKVKAATTGGRETAELQRELGGEADKCPVYELYAYLLADDDDEFAKQVYDECVGGERLCGDCKEQAAGLMREFLADHAEKREEIEANLDDIPFQFESDR